MTVQDQIRLWELERNRIKAQDGTLGGFFPSLRSFISADMLALGSPPLQAFCTPRSHPKPTTNTSSITPGNWTSCCGRTLQNAASLEASRAMRIFEASSSGVQAEEGKCFRSAKGHLYAAASDSAAKRTGCEWPSRMHVKGADELLRNGESRSSVGPTRFCWFISVRCARRQSYVVLNRALKNIPC